MTFTTADFAAIVSAVPSQRQIPAFVAFNNQLEAFAISAQYADEVELDTASPLVSQAEVTYSNKETSTVYAISKKAGIIFAANSPLTTFTKAIS